MNNKMARRGEIYWLELAQATGSEQAGHRPVLIIQNDIGNRISPTTIVAVITSQHHRKRYPFHVPLTARESGLRLDGTVLCEQLYTVEQTRLSPRIGFLGSAKMQEVDLALHYSLGLQQ